jgi:hypothetical protein
MNAKFGHEQAKNGAIDLSLEHRNYFTSPGIEIATGTDGKKEDVGRVKWKVKRTACTCPNCANQVSKR